MLSVARSAKLAGTDKAVIVSSNGCRMGSSEWAHKIVRVSSTAEICDRSSNIFVSVIMIDVLLMFVLLHTVVLIY